jgi:hypothetical protein
MSRFFVITMLLAGLAACGPIRVPEPPTPIAMPTAEVQAVRLVATSPEASRYLITVTLTNPNDFSLPMIDAEYRLKVGGEQYTGDTSPNATLPRNGAITVTLPAVVTASGDSYEASGSIQFDPSSQIKQLFYDAGIPRPRASFNAQGPIEVAAGAPAATPAPEATPAPAPPAAAPAPAQDPAPAPAPAP